MRHTSPESNRFAPIDLNDGHYLFVIRKGPEPLESFRAMTANAVLHQNGFCDSVVLFLGCSILNPAQNLLLVSGSGKKLLHAAAMDLRGQAGIVPVTVESALEVADREARLAIGQAVGHIQVEECYQITYPQHYDRVADH